MDDNLDISECLIGFVLNNFCVNKADKEDKFNIRLGIWIIFQFGLLIYYIIQMSIYQNVETINILPAFFYCLLSTYYIQSCEEDYIYNGNLNMYKRQKKLKIIDFLQNIIVIIILLYQRYKQNQENITNLVTLILFGCDSALNIVEFLRLKKKDDMNNESYGATKCIYYGTLVGAALSLTAWIIIFPIEELFLFKQERWGSYAQVFALILIHLVLSFKIFRYKKPKEQINKTRKSKAFLLSAYGFTQGAYQIIVAAINVVYQILKNIYRLCKKI